MRLGFLAVLAVSFAALCASATDGVAGGVVHQGVRGRLAASDSESDAAGSFRLRIRSRRSGAVTENVEVDARGLDATKAEDGSLPEYRVWLVTSDASAEGDFGAMRLSGRGRARLRWNSRRDAYPEGVTGLDGFGGGKVEVRLGDTVVLSGDAPSFLDSDDDNGQGSGAATVSRASSRLRAADGVRAQGYVEARYANRPRVVRQTIRVAAVLLDRAAGPYTVVLIDDAAAETELGSLEPHGRLGQARLVLDTEDGDAVPGDDVRALGGQTVEVRDSGGSVVLSGTFPTLD